VRADADACIGDDDVRRAEAVDEIARRVGERALIGDVERVMGRRARQAAGRPAAGNQSEDSRR